MIQNPVQHSKKSTSTAGYTLVEVLMFMGLFSMFLVLLTNMFATILETQQRSLATSYVEQTGRFVLARLMYDVHRATSITTPAAAGSTDTSLDLNIDGVPYSYSIDNGVFQLSNSSGVHDLHAGQVTVSNFSLTRIGNVNGKHTLQLSFDVESVVPDTTGIQSRTFSTTLGIR